MHPQAQLGLEDDVQLAVGKLEAMPDLGVSVQKQAGPGLKTLE